MVHLCSVLFKLLLLYLFGKCTEFRYEKFVNHVEEFLTLWTNFFLISFIFIKFYLFAFEFHWDDAKIFFQQYGYGFSVVTRQENWKFSYDKSKRNYRAWNVSLWKSVQSEWESDHFFPLFFVGFEFIAPCERIKWRPSYWSHIHYYGAWDWDTFTHAYTFGNKNENIMMHSGISGQA